MKIYDNLQETKNSDRYQYVFHIITFKKPIEFKHGLISFSSSGDSR